MWQSELVHGAGELGAVRGPVSRHAQVRRDPLHLLAQDRRYQTVGYWIKKNIWDLTKIFFQATAPLVPAAALAALQLWVLAAERRGGAGQTVRAGRGGGGEAVSLQQQQQQQAAVLLQLPHPDPGGDHHLAPAQDPHHHAQTHHHNNNNTTHNHTSSGLHYNNNNSSSGGGDRGLGGARRGNIKSCGCIVTAD